MEEKMTKILLVCNAGMSTSMLVQKMKDCAKTAGIEADISAKAATELSAEGTDAQVILVGPQVKFIANDLKAKFEPKGIKVAVIDQVDYGRMNGEKVLKDAIALVGK